MAHIRVMSALTVGVVLGCKKLDERGILDKYGSDGGELFDQVFNISRYGFAPFDVSDACCLVDAKRFAGALRSSVPGLAGHVLQVRVNEESSSYMTGTKVVRILITDTGVIKVREYTLFDHGGYYRRSRFYRFSCDSGVVQIQTSETDANSKASFGLTRATIGKEDLLQTKSKEATVGKEKPVATESKEATTTNKPVQTKSKEAIIGKEDPVRTNSKGERTGWQLTLQGRALETKEDSMAIDRLSVSHLALTIGALNMSYYFSTAPYNYKTPHFDLQLQEDRMEAVITLNLAGKMHAAKSVLELEYTVYSGGLGELTWNTSSSTLVVTPVTSAKQALHELTEIYVFANTVACVQDQESTVLPITLSRKKTKGFVGSVVIEGRVEGVEVCDSVIWDPTNADVGEGKFEIVESAATFYAEGAAEGAAEAYTSPTDGPIGADTSGAIGKAETSRATPLLLLQAIMMIMRLVALPLLNC